VIALAIRRRFVIRDLFIELAHRKAVSVVALEKQSRREML